MPVPPTISFSHLCLQRLLAFGGADGAELVLEQLDARSGRVAISGPAAEVFVDHLIREMLMLGKSIELRVEDEVARRRWQDKIAAETLPAAQEFRPALSYDLTKHQQRKEQLTQAGFDGHGLADMLGLLLAYRKHPGEQLLSRQINFSDFEFTASEYLELKDQLNTTQRLLPKIGRLPNAFQGLNAGIFRHQSLEDSQEFIAGALVDFLKTGSELQKDFMVAGNGYYNQRRNWYRSVYFRLLSEINELRGQIDLFIQTHGSKALAGTPGKLAAGLSKKKRLQREALAALDVQLERLKTDHEESIPFNFVWSPKEGEGRERWEELLNNYRERLEAWFENHRRLVREEVLGMSVKSIGSPASDPYAARLYDLEERLNTYVGKINESGVFQRPFTAEAGTTARQQKLLESLLEKLLELQQLLPEYARFYRWQHNWFSLPARLRRVVAPLLLLPREDWAGIFSAWYFEQGILEKNRREYATVDPVHVLQLGDRIITARAKIKGKAKENDQVSLFHISIPQSKPNKRSSDLVIQLYGIPPSSEEDVLYLAAPGSIPNTVYLKHTEYFDPALAFFQTWQGVGSPDWKVSTMTREWQEIVPLLRTLITEPQSLGEEALALAKAKFWSLGNIPVLIGLYENGQVESIPFWEYTGQKLKGGVLVLPGESLPTQQLPTADHWWRLLLSTSGIRLLHDLPAAEITKHLLSDGPNTAYGIAAFIRGAEAIMEEDQESFAAIARENRTRMGYSSPKSGLLMQEILPLLQERLPNYRFDLHRAWRSTYLPLLLTSPLGKRHVILPDGLLPGLNDTMSQINQQGALVAAGFELHYLYSENVLTDLQGCIDQLRVDLKKA